MRVLVCGGREYNKREHLYAVLDTVGITTLIHGAAPGADTLADDWAKARGIPRLPYEADWKRLGKRAGPVRNLLMLQEGRPELVVAFPGGDGTANMVSVAAKAGVPVHMVLT